MLAFGLAILTLGLPTAPTLVVAPLPSGATEVAFDHIGSVDRFTLAVPASAHVELPALGTPLATGVATLDGMPGTAVADVAADPISLPHSRTDVSSGWELRLATGGTELVAPGVVIVRPTSTTIEFFAPVGHRLSGLDLVFPTTFRAGVGRSTWTFTSPSRAETNVLEADVVSPRRISLRASYDRGEGRLVVHGNVPLGAGGGVVVRADGRALGRVSVWRDGHFQFIRLMPRPQTVSAYQPPVARPCRFDYVGHCYTSTRSPAWSRLVRVR